MRRRCTLLRWWHRCCMLSNLFFQNLLRPFIYFVVVIAGPESLGILACDRCGILLQCLRLPSGESGCWGVLARVRQGPPAAQNARFLSRKHARARALARSSRRRRRKRKGKGRVGLGQNPARFFFWHLTCSGVEVGGGENCQKSLFLRFLCF